MASEHQQTDSISDVPTEIEALNEHVEWGVANLYFDPEDRKTVSLVVRGEDGEILSESTLSRRSGVYSLALVTDEPADPSEYRNRRDDLPEWVQWEFRDPPLDHLVNAAECRSCGERNEYILDSTPRDVGSTAWEHIRHKGTCPHADERDRETWPERKRSRDLKTRPHPSVMALDCIWREIDELYAAREESEDGILWEAAEDRLVSIGRALEDRMGPRYPDCPACGHSIEMFEGRIVRCVNGCDIENAVIEAWLRENRRVWGRRGHGDRGRSEEVSRSDDG